MITATYLPLNIKVQITDANAARRTADITAIDCEPFTRYTHGGPMNVASATVSRDSLADIVASEIENERRHEAARLAVIRCHERNMREIAQVRAEREWVEVMTTPLYSEIPF